MIAYHGFAERLLRFQFVDLAEQIYTTPRHLTQLVTRAQSSSSTQLVNHLPSSRGRRAETESRRAGSRAAVSDSRRA
jgi:hypothetical protein